MTLDDQSDDQLLRLGRAGNEAAFLTLYYRRRQAVHRFALHMSGSREIAEEVLQDIFLSLLAESGYSPERGTPEAFLIGMARNQVRRHLQQARRSETSLQNAESQDPRCEIHEDLSLEGDLKALRKAILALPENYRAVTVLCELEELSYEQAALQLGCAVGTVRSRLHRARAFLEAKLRRRMVCPSATAR